MEEPVDVNCPFCGEPTTVFVDISAGNQRYIEDCQVCCKPINMSIRISRDGEPSVSTDR